MHTGRPATPRNDATVKDFTDNADTSTYMNTT